MSKHITECVQLRVRERDLFAALSAEICDDNPWSSLTTDVRLGELFAETQPMAGLSMHSLWAKLEGEGKCSFRHRAE
jgi:hypothetical protein